MIPVVTVNVQDPVLKRARAVVGLLFALTGEMDSPSPRLTPNFNARVFSREERLELLGELSDATVKLSSFWFGVLKIEILDGGDLTYFVEHFPRFTIYAHAIEQLLEKLYREFTPEYTAEQLNQLRSKRSALTEVVEALTPTHILLQRHLRATVFVVPEQAWVDEENTQELYPLLSKLRDDYFAAPKSEILATYLTAVGHSEARAAEIDQSTLADRGRWKVELVRTMLAELNSELEVQSLLAVLEEEKLS
jgi:hypothetical protein